MWKSVLYPDRCTARWIPEATNTHSECVLLIAFPLQQWLHERASLLRYTYTASLPVTDNLKFDKYLLIAGLYTMCNKKFLDIFIMST